jgi:group I intron endonuclease
MAKRLKRIYGVYAITCTVNGRQYVGSAASVRNRWGTHRWALRHGHHNNKELQADWDKYGESVFEFRTIAEIREPGLRRAVEQAYLDQVFANGNPYNCNPDANGRTGAKLTADQRLAMSLARRGRNLSPEHRAAISEAAIRRYASQKGTPEMQARMAEMGRGNLGKPKSAEHRTNIAKGKRRLNEEQVADIRARYAAGAATQTALAAEFGVHQGTISNIVRGRGYQKEPGTQP